MEFVKPITSDHDLIELAKRLNVHLDGVVTIDEVDRPLTKGSYIILLRAGPGVGHWVAACNGEWFDSMGVGPPTIAGRLPYNQIQYQDTYGEFCGSWAMLFLYARQRRMPQLLRGFHNLDVDAL